MDYFIRETEWKPLDFVKHYNTRHGDPAAVWHHLRKDLQSLVSSDAIQQETKQRANDLLRTWQVTLFWYVMDNKGVRLILLKENGVK